MNAFTTDPTDPTYLPPAATEPLVTVPAPAIGTDMVYATLEGDVYVASGVEGGVFARYMTPDEARDLASRLYVAADEADDSGCPICAGADPHCPVSEG